MKLDDDVRRALLAREGPPPGASAKTLAALRMRVGGPGGPDDPGDLDAEFGDGLDQPVDRLADLASGHGGQMAWAAKVVAATISLTGAGLLVVKLGALALAAVGGEAPRSDSHVPAAAQDAHGALEPSPADPRPDGSASTSHDHDHDHGAKARPAVQHGAPVVGPDESPGSELGAEVAILRAAKQLSATDPAAALEQLDHHGERFPDGALAPEREALRDELSRAGTDGERAGDDPGEP